MTHSSARQYFAARQETARDPLKLRLCRVTSRSALRFLCEHAVARQSSPSVPHRPHTVAPICVHSDGYFARCRKSSIFRKAMAHRFRLLSNVMGMRVSDAIYVSTMFDRPDIRCIGGHLAKRFGQEASTWSEMARQ